ncbi:MAG: class I SAM-dependent methyltransferase [Verrucomicrobiota bacterium]
MNREEQIQEASRQQFDRRSAHYGKGHILKSTDDLASALPALRPRGGESLLDVATGAGHTACYFAGLGLDVTACDISEKMLEQTRAQAAERDLTIRTECHTAESLPYESGSFDIVTCRVAAHHFACPASFTMDVSRVLKPDGRFLLIDGTVEDGYPEAQAWAHEVEVLRDPSHQKFVTPDEWTHMTGHVAMRVIHRQIQPFKQPDLEWYFDTADTSPENRDKVRELIKHAPPEARDLFQVGEEDGKRIWWWQRLVMVAIKK